FFAAVEVKKERHLVLDYGSADVPAVLANLKRSTLARADCEGIARVQTFVCEVEIDAAAEFISPGTRKNIYPSGRLIIFRRKRILVNANLADRFFRRHVRSRKPIDKNLAATGTD